VNLYSEETGRLHAQFYLKLSSTWSVFMQSTMHIIKTKLELR
jgi:hypothetical protein